MDHAAPNTIVAAYVVLHHWLDIATREAECLIYPFYGLSQLGQSLVGATSFRLSNGST